MQRRHTLRHLIWRGATAAVSNALMVTGAYPLLPHAVRALQRDRGLIEHPVRAAIAEWGMAIATSTLRPAGWFPLPGGVGPRPIIVVHGYAQNRAVFLPLAYRLARAGLGPIVGFEYWTLGRVAAGARQLGWFVDHVLAETGAAQVDIIGHSMGGVVGRYLVAFGGGDGKVANLVTLGSPHAGTEMSSVGLGHPARELLTGSKLLIRLSAAPAPTHTKILTIWSHADALVPSSTQADVPGAVRVEFTDLGHVALLGSRRVARTIIERLGDGG